VTERLAAMSDREPADIGLTRADLPPTFDPITDQLLNLDKQGYDTHVS